MNAEETKRWKAKQLRYKKPIVRDLNLDKIQEDLWNIMEECENIRWYTDSDDGNDSLINAFDGDEDEACEFKMMFAYLCAECEQMSEDLNEEWVPECFDIFFVAAGAGESKLPVPESRREEAGTDGLHAAEWTGGIWIGVGYDWIN